MQSSRWRHGCFTCENILTRRANQRHYFIIAAALGISESDHFIVGKNGHASLRGMKLI
jgi:hypothetical protein